MSGAGVTYIPTAGNGQGTAQESVSVKAIVPPKKIMKLVGQAVKEWGMIEEGDRLLLGLSGGKDSLALLHILLALQVRPDCSFYLILSKPYKLFHYHAFISTNTLSSPFTSLHLYTTREPITNN
jgi:hypothetical protein